MEKIIYILRGIPGSGKSTVAESLMTKAICTADDYHVRDGEYNWKPENIKKAHEWCQRKCKRFMKANAERIVVANTSTTEKELEPYMRLAHIHGYLVFSLIVENRHGGKNGHDVPEETLNKMRGRFNIEL